MRDRRKTPRRAISRLAKIEIGSSVYGCLVTDLSEGGVRLYIEGVEVPETFVLLMPDDDGIIRPRDCQVIWRLRYEIGANFTDVPRTKEKPKRSRARQPAAA
jgi:hypothetical protein